MTPDDVEKLILGLDENPIEAWKEMQKNWKGGALIMPDTELERRKEYKKMLQTLFAQEGISETSFPKDTWLCGKIRRILRKEA